MGTGFFVHRRKVSAVERVEFFSYRVSYMVQRGRWCNGIVRMCMHEVRRKVMIQNTVFIRK
jgi:hypothetical protein